jgi:hypothetical protein
VSAIPIARIVDWETLGKVVLYSLVSGVGTVAIFGLGVSSVAGALDSLRRGRSLAGAAWGLLAAACVASAIGAVVLGVVVMSTKT